MVALAESGTDSYYAFPFRNSLPKGDICRRRAMMGGISRMTVSISASLVKRDSEKRIDPWAQVNGTPMARRTWEGSSDPDVQALPDEAQIPNSDSSSKMASPSTNSKAIEVVLGSRSAPPPLIRSEERRVGKE